MQRFKNILYFADGSLEDSPAFKRALSLAASNQARLTVVDVITALDVNPELEQRLGKSITELLHDNHMNAMSGLIAPYQEKGQVIYTQILYGTPFVEVIRAVQRNNFDLLIKAARSPKGLTERLLGSTDLHLLRKSPCPVWIERPGTRQPYAKVLATINPMAEKPQENCDQLVMQLASSLAQLENAQLTVLHGWKLEGESMLRGSRSGVSDSEVDKLVAERAFARVCGQIRLARRRYSSGKGRSRFLNSAT